MKKLLILISIVTILSGCTGEHKDFVKIGKLNSLYEKINIVKDKETGCLYLESPKNFTAYYGKDGKVQGCGELTKD